MVQNYMDYTHDDCINIFTQGQVNRMLPLFSPKGARIKLIYHDSGKKFHGIFNFLHIFTVCDNGILEDGEECDDGNNVSGDGCSDDCYVEFAWKCVQDDLTGISKCKSECPLIFSDDFEHNSYQIDKWAPTPFGWVVTDALGTSGNATAYVPNEGTFTNYLLTTQPILLPKIGNIFLTFNMKYNTAVGSDGRCADGLRVVASNDKFTTM